MDNGMSRSDIEAALRGFADEFKIDPHDAELLLEDVGADGLDRETFGDQLEFRGYPELAAVVYANGAEP